MSYFSTVPQERGNQDEKTNRETEIGEADFGGADGDGRDDARAGRGVGG